jgi:TolB-like protein
MRPIFRRRAALTVLAAALILAIALISYRQFPLQGASQAVVAERAASAPQAGVISIAVLPFANLSGDASQEFFSDGMTEEITAALAKIPGLRVVARTSAFQFKAQNRDIQSIGQQLHATHFIEGSVRKEGERVRVTAQLVKADDGIGLWTDNYDRELKGIFAMQEDIAQAIAGALRVPLGLAPGESLVSNRGIDPESYEQYLRARAILRNRNLPEMRAKGPDAIRMLEQVVARDPTYAPAWGLLALMSVDRQRKKMAAEEAIRLDSRNAAAYTALGGLQGVSGNWAAMEDLRRKALSLDPDDAESLDIFSNVLALVGRRKESLSNREKLRFLEPFVPIYNYITATIMIINGQNREAIEILKTLPSAVPRNIALAQAYAAEGRYGDAADTLLLATTQDQASERQSMEDAARLLRTAPSKVKAPAALPAFDQQLSFVYLHIGAPERVLDYQERQAAYPLLGASQVRYLWGPEFSPVRKTERFKTFVRKMRFVEYWRARGWPDLCHPTTGDDFVCD